MKFLTLFKLTIIFIFLIVVSVFDKTYAQSPWINFFEHDTLVDKGLGQVTIHVTKTKSTEKRPLLIYIDGSVNYPLFYRKSNGNYNTSVAFDIAKYAKDYTIVLISKPGTPFIDSLRYHDGSPYYPTSEIYNHYYSLQWRAKAASIAIDYVVKHRPVDKKKIVVMGYSEGSQVAPAVAVLNKKVTYVVCFVGNGLNQLYDFIINTRLDVDRKIITAEQGQKIVDSLYDVYGKIYANSASTEHTWFGATYLKWSSFSETTPLENMLKLNIPILYLAGGKDNNQTIIDMDYVKLEFLRKCKTNLTYKVYPNSNHGFQETVINNGEETRIDRSDEVNQFAIDWINSINRTVR